ncbi:MurR/RpiR family transcriptional regulator [bacterium 1XD21-13]|nr:MurR/RpiR family transcriptional regulator [bacterium 1XD21-13]
MNVIAKLQEILPDLSKNERRIADYFLQHPKNIDEYSSEAIAAICGASRSTIIRLCHKLGYRGYSEFKYALLHEQEQVSPAPGFSFLPAASADDVFYPQLGVKTLLDGGRRRTKNLYGVVKRTVPAGQVRQ